METIECKYCNSPNISNESRQLCARCYGCLYSKNRLDEYPNANIYIKRLKKRYGNKIILEFELCMYNLKHTLTSVGKKYGFCRERARQIFNDLFGNKSYRASRDWLRLIIDKEKRIIQLNPINKAKRAKTGSFVRMGWETEALVYNKLLKLGFDVFYPLKRSPYDLIVNSLKIEVKTGCPHKTIDNVIYRRAVLTKSELEAADILIIHIPDTKKFYVIPVWLLKRRTFYIRISTRKMRPNKTAVRYEKYKNAWYLLGIRNINPYTITGFKLNL